MERFVQRVRSKIFQFISLGYLDDSMLRISEYVSPPLVKCILMLLVPWLLYQTIVTCIYMVAYFTAAHASWVYMHNNSYLEFSLYGWIIQVNWHLQSISLVSCTISFISNENLDWNWSVEPFYFFRTKLLPYMKTCLL